MLRIAFAFSCIFLFAFPALGQESENLPLKLTVSLKKDSFCLNQAIPVKAVLENITTDKIAIDKNSLWYTHSSQYTVSEVILPKNRRRRGSGSGVASTSISTVIGHHGPDYVGDYLILSAGQKFEDTSSFAGSVYFNKTGIYTFELTYGQFLRDSFEEKEVWRGAVRSNKVTFEIVACKASVRK
ncbi:MAG TPA: hypothetical protein VGB68_04680 [Pyrinomonadaceae bacterium]|jgi:hypothetical protein